MYYLPNQVSVPTITSAIRNYQFRSFIREGVSIMMGSAGSPFSEIFYRKSTWTGGLPVNLANGSLWRLPIISTSLLVTTPGLREEIEEVVRLARVVLALEVHLGNSPCYNAQLMAVGLYLLRANYNLPAQEWLELVGFESSAHIFAFTYNVAHALSLARPVLLPFLMPSGFDPPVDFSQN